MSSEIGQRAIVLGGTGMVGKQLTKQLLASPRYSSVTLLVRRPLNEKEQEFFANHQKLIVKNVDFDNLEESKDVFKGQDVGFCCLGTTRAQAGSAEAFVKIDHDIPLKAAQLFKEAVGANARFSLLTSQNANANSWLLYPRTKGLLENAIIALNFAKTSIHRPGLLLFDGERPSPRFFEGLAISAAKSLGIQTGTIHVNDVATAMRLVDENIHSEPVKFFDNHELLKLARGE